jgi:hypothetical protein
MTGKLEMVIASGLGQLQNLATSQALKTPD